MPGPLKNAVAWLSVQKPSPWTGLPVLLAACSPGAFGGARALLSWRATLANMGAVVLPQALTIPHADQALDPTGRPVEARSAETTRRTLEAFATFCEKLAR